MNTPPFEQAQRGPVLEVRGFLLSIVGKLALARFLFILQNS
jgi:hypothetical protein